MGKVKKQTREERLLKKRLAERRRYNRIKNDDNLWKQKQEADKLRYLRRKEDKKQLSISEMSPRQQRVQRKRWRKNFKAYYLRKKEQKRTAQLLANSTPPESEHGSDIELIRQDEVVLPPSPSIVSDEIYICKPSSSTYPDRQVASCSSTAQRRLRYKKDREILKLKLKIANLSKINERYRKQIERISNNNRSIIGKLCDNREDTTQMSKKIIKKHNKSSRRMTRGISTAIKEDIANFLGEDRHSRLCAGKKECIVKNKIKKQKRYLSDSLINLHEKYMKEKNIKISYPAFCRLRPFWILIPNINSRETCLCKLHVNVNLVIQALWQKKITSVNNSRDLLVKTCCDPYNVNCLHRNCNMCKDKVMPYLEFSNDQEICYWQWVTRVQDLRDTQKKVRVTEKIKMRKPPLEVIAEFDSLLNDFFIHSGNISGQYQAITFLKTNLPVGHCILHIDFSENYAVKCHEEVQSYHFGGSRKQVTLHTAVIYYREANVDELKHQSFCTISECTRHDVSAVWAHIIPILDYITEKICSNLQCIHFISDSPSSQYRNKKIFHVISSFHQYINSLRIVTWNYSESGHGKGAPDGVGATIKQAADRAVSRRMDITDIDDFMNVISQTIHNIVIRTVTEYDVYEKDLLFPQNVNGFPGCMKIHQIVWTFDSNVIAARKLSYTENPCIEEAILCPHGQHLGFYKLPSNKINDVVVPLADSTREISILRKQGWQTNIQNANTELNKNKVVILSDIMVKPADNTLTENILLSFEEEATQKKMYGKENEPDLPINDEILENLITIPLKEDELDIDDLNIF